MRKNRSYRIRLAPVIMALAMAVAAPGLCASSATAAADTAPTQNTAMRSDISALMSRIDALPSVDDVTADDADEVVRLKKTYDSLSLSDRLQVSNSDKLTAICDKLEESGVISTTSGTEQDNARTDAPTDGDTAVQTTRYRFAMQQDTSLSLVMRFVTDIDGDGSGDFPDRMVLTDPYGNTTPVTRSASALHDDTMDVDLVWTKNFLQLDIRSMTPGTWTIETSSPVTVSRMAYAGAKKTIKPESTSVQAPAEGETAVATPVPEETDGEQAAIEAAEAQRRGSMIKLVAIAVGGAGLVVFLLRFSKTNHPAGSRDKADGYDTSTDEQETMPSPDEHQQEELMAALKKAQEKEQQNWTGRETEREDKTETGHEDKQTESGDEKNRTGGDELTEYTEGDTEVLSANRQTEPARSAAQSPDEGNGGQTSGENDEDDTEDIGGID